MNNSLLINQTSGIVEYYTPPIIVEAARNVLGTIDLDPASSLAANRIVKSTHIFTEKDDGLKQKWFGNVWMNHPFSRKYNISWINKIENEYESDNVKEACCICFASTSEKWFRPLLRRPQCYLSPRTNYLLEDGTVYKGVTKGSVVTYFGLDIDRFYDAFEKLGEIKISYQRK